jgi:hypothetical protein
MRRSAFILVAVNLGACRPAREDRATREDRPTREPATSIEAEAREVVAALKARDGQALSARAHPTKGVRFSPYPYVRADSDVMLSRQQLAGIFGDSSTRRWGYADGSGAPLDWTFNRYYDRYVYDADFSKAPVVRANAGPAKSGNTPNNVAEVYRGAQWVEFHFPSIDPKYEGMDWRSLWLVFERSGDAWKLVGVVHGAWTI